MEVYPDVSDDADQYTGYSVAYTTSPKKPSVVFLTVGGTSEASPLFAGTEADVIQARGGVALGYANPTLYGFYGSQAFIDVTDTPQGAGKTEAVVSPAADGVKAELETMGQAQLTGLSAGPGLRRRDRPGHALRRSSTASSPSKSRAILLYDNAISGNCYKVRLLLTQLGIGFERRELSVIDRSDREQILGELNPGLRVPTLVLDDGRALGESGAILGYLARGTEFWPDEAYAHAQTLQWLFFEQYSHEPHIAVARFWAHAGIIPDRRRSARPSSAPARPPSTRWSTTSPLGSSSSPSATRSPTSRSTPTPTSRPRAASRSRPTRRSAPGWSASRPSPATSRSPPDPASRGGRQ